MKDTESVIRVIRDAFGKNEYPGDPSLQSSFQGCEPFEEEEFVAEIRERKTDP